MGRGRLSKSQTVNNWLRQTNSFFTKEITRQTEREREREREREGEREGDREGDRERWKGSFKLKGCKIFQLITMYKPYINPSQTKKYQ